MEGFYARVVATVAGSVDEFTEDDAALVRESLRALVDVRLEHVQLHAEAGSLVLTVLVAAASESEADEMVITLREALSSAQEATSLLGVTVEATPAISSISRMEPERVSPPPSGPVRKPGGEEPDALTSASASQSAGVLAAIIIGCLALGSIVLWLARRRERRESEKRGEGRAVQPDSEADDATMLPSAEPSDAGAQEPAESDAGTEEPASHRAAPKLDLRSRATHHRRPPPAMLPEDSTPRKCGPRQLKLIRRAPRLPEQVDSVPPGLGLQRISSSRAPRGATWEFSELPPGQLAPDPGEDAVDDLEHLDIYNNTWTALHSHTRIDI